ncbi:MAG: pantoate--beta-alanine ligase [Candidatus Margulisiibacteriota bacterium]
MREIRKIKEMYLFAQKAKAYGKTIGFVPTMGALHEGHLSLVAEARRRCDLVVVSIFVNPTQFGPNEDYRCYPKQLSKDKKLLKDLEVDVVFVPEAAEMYPKGFRSWVEVEGLSNKMCGRSRPGHFRGVTTVVAKLFHIVCPDIAFFGEKDFQQQVIIKQMVKDLNFAVKIVALPTVREFDGLAMSSRNAYLNVQERKSATILYRALCLAKDEILKGERDPKKIIYKMRTFMGSEPKLRLDYVTIVDPNTLEEVPRIKGRVLIALAAYLGKARLIDNMLVEGQ